MQRETVLALPPNMREEEMTTIQDRPPNFRDEEGKLFLVRCFACNTERGRENWAMAVADGRCSWCGWHEEEK